MAVSPMELVPKVYWVGALDPKLRIFDIIMHTETGSTYNAYLVCGSQKTALIETVKRGFTAELFERIEAVCPLEQIDYLIANHLEPDHSGSLLECLKRMPRARVVVSKNGASFLRELLNQDVDALAVGTGDRIDLGGKSLEFITAPFLHWPDTMFTYLPEDQILFSCDFFGSHQCPPVLWADQAGDGWKDFRFYFDCILRPFKEYVLKGLAAIEALPLRLIAPSHGPILNRDLDRYRKAYHEWASVPLPAPEGSLLVFFASVYGMTGQLAQALAEGSRELGVRTTVIDLIEARIPDFLDRIEAADGLAVGSCTINGDAVEPVWQLLSSCATIKLKGKWGAAFGSFGWSGEAVPMIEERLKGLKLKLVGAGVRVRFTPRPEDLAAAKELGKTLALKIQETIADAANPAPVNP